MQERVKKHFLKKKKNVQKHNLQCNPLVRYNGFQT